MMNAKLFTSFFTLLFFLLLADSNPAQHIFTAREIAGTYFTGGNFGGSTVEIKADGTYSQGNYDCTQSIESFGKYDISDGILRFTILKYTGKNIGNEKKEFNLLNAKTRKKFHGYKSDEEDTPPKTEFSFIPIKWGERIYLLEEPELKKFSEAVNLGFEPRAAMRSDPDVWTFFLRVGDERKNVSGKPELPIKWQSLLLDKPVTAKIISAEKQGNETFGIINKGSRDGLKVGITMLAEDNQTSMFTRLGTIVSIEEDSAKIQMINLKVGETIRSRRTSIDK